RFTATVVVRRRRRITAGGETQKGGDCPNDGTRTHSQIGHGPDLPPVRPRIASDSGGRSGAKPSPGEGRYTVREPSARVPPGGGARAANLARKVCGKRPSTPCAMRPSRRLRCCALGSSRAYLVPIDGEATP